MEPAFLLRLKDLKGDLMRSGIILIVSVIADKTPEVGVQDCGVIEAICAM